MKDKVLKLCQRLKCCTINDITQFIDTDEVVLENLITYLVQEDLISNNNGVITVLENKKDVFQQKNLQLMFQYNSSENIDIIIRSFCLNIPPQKACKLVNLSTSCISEYYGVFRKEIFEYQKEELLKYYLEKPQKGRFRKFFEKYAYFYVYENKVFVSKCLLSSKVEKGFTKKEIREFKRTYCYLKRIENHNINENYLYYRLADSIWRHEKSFEELYTILLKLLKIE
ncbi:unknown [Clostridium sp. CAG:715]|nr:unknown [Clostridium sp. CAG:715]